MTEASASWLQEVLLVAQLCVEWVGLNPRTFLCCLKQADNGKVMWPLVNMLNFFWLAQSNRTFGLDLCLEQTQSGRLYPILRNS